MLKWEKPRPYHEIYSNKKAKVYLSYRSNEETKDMPSLINLPRTQSVDSFRPETAIVLKKDKKKAEELAKLSGRRVGKAININEQGDTYYPTPVFAQTEADLKQRASQIQPGQDEVSVAIQVDFELK